MQVKYLNKRECHRIFFCYLKGINGFHQAPKRMGPEQFSHSLKVSKVTPRQGTGDYSIN